MLNFGELCNSKLYGLHAFDNMAIIKFKLFKNRKVDCHMYIATKTAETCNQELSKFI